MSEIGCSAFLSSRREPKSSLDDFPTPPWATRALLSEVLVPSMQMHQLRLSGRNVPIPASNLAYQTVWEPAFNRGYMAGPLAERFGRVIASDLAVYEDAARHPSAAELEPASVDFLADDGLIFGQKWHLDWIITNPPFNTAPEFIERALELKPRWGVAMFVRLGFLEGQRRFETIFRERPPAVIAQFVERVPIHKGRVKDPARSYPVLTRTGETEMRKPSTQAAYCWLLWLHDWFPRPTHFVWIPPCRRRFERPGDYPE